MSSITQVQQDLLGRMQQLQDVASGTTIKPADQAAPDAGGMFMAAMRSVEAGREAVVVGRAVEKGSVPVRMRSAFGGTRIVDMLVGEQLPRIC